MFPPFFSYNNPLFDTFQKCLTFKLNGGSIMEKKLLATAFTALLFLNFNGQAQASQIERPCTPPVGSWVKTCDIVNFTITFDKTKSLCTLKTTCVDGKQQKVPSSVQWHVAREESFANCGGQLKLNDVCN